MKLLRAVQQGEIETVGARQPQKVNVRLISATNKDLINEVREGRFREDLYYRLNVFPIAIPALRRRKEDIPRSGARLCRAFCAPNSGLRLPLSVSSGAMALLTAYDWPGNIRQLENAIFRAVVLAEGAGTDGQGLSADRHADSRLCRCGEIGLQLGRDRAIEDCGRRMPNHLPPVYPHFGSAERAEARNAVADQPENAIASVDDGGNVRKLAEVEEELIRFALKFYRGQMSQVARKLGIGRSTLYRKLKDYGINPDDPFSEAA